MAILIGTDEAGYGPNLGPLVISSTVWQVPDDLLRADLYQALAGVTCRSASEDADALPVADSKVLYKPGGGLATLERSVLAALLTTGKSIGSWREAWRMLAPESVSALDQLPWYAGYDVAAPVNAEPSQIGRLGEAFGAGLSRHGVRLIEIRAVAVFPGHFNALVDRFDSKGGALSHETLHLVKRALERLDDSNIVVQCDKHGGRNRYLPLLQTVFPDRLADVAREGRQESVYRLDSARQQIEFRFTAKGEAFLPAALASMSAKYLRELAMLAFNGFWKQRIADLKTTAGYPVDAKRFKRQIQPLQRQLGIADAVLWRNR